jgi:hypothetical protein
VSVVAVPISCLRQINLCIRWTTDVWITENIAFVCIYYLKHIPRPSLKLLYMCNFVLHIYQKWSMKNMQATVIKSWAWRICSGERDALLPPSSRGSTQRTRMSVKLLCPTYFNKLIISALVVELRSSTPPIPRKCHRTRSWASSINLRNVQRIFVTSILMLSFSPLLGLLDFKLCFLKNHTSISRYFQIICPASLNFLCGIRVSVAK